MVKGDEFWYHRISHSVSDVSYKSMSLKPGSTVNSIHVLDVSATFSTVLDTNIRLKCSTPAGLYIPTAF